MPGILDKFSLKDKVVVITDGTGILGKSFVEALAEAGAKIAILGRNEERAIQRVTDSTHLGAEAIYILADVLNESAIHASKDEILKKWGRIDGLINAAGGNIPGATIGENQNLFESNVQDTIKAIELNLHGTIIPTHVFGKIITESGK